MTLESLVGRLVEVRLGSLVVVVEGFHLGFWVKVRELPHEVGYYTLVLVPMP